MHNVKIKLLMTPAGQLFWGWTLPVFTSLCTIGWTASVNLGNETITEHYYAIFLVVSALGQSYLDLCQTYFELNKNVILFHKTSPE